VAPDGEALGITCDVASCQPGRPLTERCNLLDDDCDGMIDEGTLCAAGQACVRGACVVTDVEAPVDGGVVELPMTPKPVEPAPSCAVVPGASLIVVALLLRRRRRT
jgi:hypothetical protein